MTKTLGDSIPLFVYKLNTPRTFLIKKNAVTDLAHTNLQNHHPEADFISIPIQTGEGLIGK